MTIDPGFGEDAAGGPAAQPLEIPAGPSKRVWDLERGRLTVEPKSGLPLDSLMTVAERENPKRAFLFVSTILGRHIPVRAADHRAALHLLAYGLMRELAGQCGPLLVVGFAETAVGLGAGIHDEILSRTSGSEILYLPSTRHTGTGTPWLGFQEEHSHAPGHWLLEPESALAHLAFEATELVLVDDEASTGKTFANVTAALVAARARRFARVHLVTLTDWSDGRARAAVAEAAGLPLEAVSMTALASGAGSFEPRTNARPAELPGPRPALPVSDLGPEDGAWRRGRVQSLAHNPGLFACLCDKPVLVIGTGENAYAAFQLAEAIEQTGVGPASFLATTRSPVNRGPAIAHKATFSDHYGLGIPMYLHNVDPNAWGRIVLMMEGDAARIDPDLAAALGTFVVAFPDGRVAAFAQGRPL